MVQELSKHMDRAGQIYMKAAERVTKYMIGTKDQGLYLQPIEGPFEAIQIYGISDSAYGDNKESRSSTTGYIIYMMGCATVWQSKSQKHVTLSSAEAEYVALSECVAQMYYVKQIIKEMGFKVELPMRVACDNIGALGMTNHTTSKSHTKHVDIQYHFV